MRAALYARVSREEQVEGYSIDAQKRAFHDLVESKGWEIHREYIEEGKSARTENVNKRPMFKAAIADALSGEYDVVVVHKLDRFSRNLRITLDYFDRLAKGNVTFMSINEQMDFTSPWGRLALTFLGAMAQFYSDNLSQETKKGWHERRQQGKYCGALPFGAMKSDDKDEIAVPDRQPRQIGTNGSTLTVRNYEGLKKAFDLAALGKSDREVAIALNTAGYRTTGTHGAKPFSKDTVKGMVTNRFYEGYIPDGNGGWIKAIHEPFIEPELFEEVQKAREQRTTNRRNIRSDAKVYSLSGLTRCTECGSTLRVFKGRGRPRLVCNGRIQGKGCGQTSSFVDIYEQQLMAYLKTFHIPDDYQDKIIEEHRKLEAAYKGVDTECQKKTLESRLQRLKELYEWGHKSKEEYMADYSTIQRELQQLSPEQPREDVLEGLAEFLRDITIAWNKATQEQRNRLASALFEVIWIEGKKVKAITPRDEFKPFFDMQYEGVSQNGLQWRPRWDSNPRSPA